MNLSQRIHDGYIHYRRTRVLSDYMASIIPEHLDILDVGCGDGLLAYLIALKRPDLKLTGVDVLLRDCSHIPVAQFDGHAFPMVLRASTQSCSWTCFTMPKIL